MMDVRKLYDHKSSSQEWSNYWPIIEAFGPIVVSREYGGYQDNAFVLYDDSEQLGYLRFGWGSCSHCDALRACEDFEDLQELANLLESQIRWFASPYECAKWLVEHDWEGDNVNPEDFIEKSLKYIQDGYDIQLPEGYKKDGIAAVIEKIANEYNRNDGNGAWVELPYLWKQDYHVIKHTRFLTEDIIQLYMLDLLDIETSLNFLYNYVISDKRRFEDLREYDIRYKFAHSVHKLSTEFPLQFTDCKEEMIDKMKYYYAYVFEKYVAPVAIALFGKDALKQRQDIIYKKNRLYSAVKDSVGDCLLRFHVKYMPPFEESEEIRDKYRNSDKTVYSFEIDPIYLCKRTLQESNLPGFGFVFKAEVVNKTYGDVICSIDLCDLNETTEWYYLGTQGLQSIFYMGAFNRVWLPDIVHKLGNPIFEHSNSFTTKFWDNYSSVHDIRL